MDADLNAAPPCKVETWREGGREGGAWQAAEAASAEALRQERA